MQVLIITEKPSMSRHIAPAARERWPNAEIKFVHTVPYGNFKFVYPRGLKMSDYPALSESKIRLESWDDWHRKPFALSAAGSLDSIGMGSELFTRADLIVCACDPDYIGALGFAELMFQVFGDDRAMEYPAVRLMSLSESLIRDGFSTMRPFGQMYESELEYGRVKRYFEWNWNVNALAIIGETQRRAGLPNHAPPLSKYALQLLYGMRTSDPRTEGGICNWMQQWAGTGRYVRASAGWHLGLGGMASRVQIVENIKLAGLLEPVTGSTPQQLQLSLLGHRLLDNLHPDCEDPDLPFRLANWCDKGMSAKPAIARYINTFFGKQKRFLALTDERGNQR